MQTASTPERRLFFSEPLGREKVQKRPYDVAASLGSLRCAGFDEYNIQFLARLQAHAPLNVRGWGNTTRRFGLGDDHERLSPTNVDW